MTDKKQAATNAAKSQGGDKSGRKNKKTKSLKKFWQRVCRVISWPFRMIGRALRWFWAWICGVNLIGMVNVTLLVAIIVLFTMLILDVCGCYRKPVVIVSEPSAPQVTISERNSPVTLPLANQAGTSEHRVKSINVVKNNPTAVRIATRPIACHKNQVLGNTVIDGRTAGVVLKENTVVQGNLYLQNMNKFTLPCNVRIEGHLFLRDMGLLQFCGQFTVTGNIYVSPRSSFGPLPKTARIGGHLIF